MSDHGPALTIRLSDNRFPCLLIHQAWNERHWVKFHFKTMQGIKNWTNAEAAEKVAHDRETHQRDLFESIEKGDSEVEILRCRLCRKAMSASTGTTRSTSPRYGRTRTIR